MVSGVKKGNLRLVQLKRRQKIKPIEKICKFYEQYWDDPEQRMYRLRECHNQKNTGGASSSYAESSFVHRIDFHGDRTYSEWWPNRGMSYRCWGQPEKMAKCPLVEYKRR